MSHDDDGLEQKAEDGFTLVELLIVIVVLGILATIAVFAVAGITQEAETNVCFTDRASVQTAVEAYFTLYDGAYPAGGDDGSFLIELYDAGLLREEPQTPEDWFMSPQGEVTVAPTCEVV